MFLLSDVESNNDSSSPSPSGNEVKFRGKSANRPASLDPIPEKYKGKHYIGTSPTKTQNGDMNKLVEVSEK